MNGWLLRMAAKAEERRVRLALWTVEKLLKRAQHQLNVLGFTEHDKSPQLALRQSLRTCRIHLVRYQRVAGLITQDEVDEKLKEHPRAA